MSSPSKASQFPEPLYFHSTTINQDIEQRSKSILQIVLSGVGHRVPAHALSHAWGGTRQAGRMPNSGGRMAANSVANHARVCVRTYIR